MKIRLGYVCIQNTVNISYTHTITYSNYLKLSKEKGEKKIDSFIKKNLQNLLLILKYNVQNQVYFFRFSHNLIPLATHESVKFNYIIPYIKEWEKIGIYIKNNQLRIDVHPDHFCVLNSIHENVIKQSINTLEFIYQIYQAMHIEGLAILHIGSGSPNKEVAIKRFYETWKNIPIHIQKMIILENDDKTFTALEVLEICETLNIPMVFDYHHHICNPGKVKLETILKRILDTWKNTSIIPKMHFSSPKSKKEIRAHHQLIDAHTFISFIDLLKSYQTDVDIMLECKGKDESLFRLSRQLHFYTDYKFINNSTFIIK